MAADVTIKMKPTDFDVLREALSIAVDSYLAASKESGRDYKFGADQRTKAAQVKLLLENLK